MQEDFSDAEKRRITGHMKTLRFLAAATLLLSNCSFCSASELSFVPNGDSNAGVVKGEVPLSFLGAVPLRGGSVVLNDKVVSVKAIPEYGDSLRTVLAGSVLRAEATTSGANTSITGIVIFLMGEWMRHIDDESQVDVIFKSDGQIRGRIIGREGDALVVQLADGTRRQVPLATMLYLRSPRVFVFTMKGSGKSTMDKDSGLIADISSANFRTTSTPRAVSLSSVVPRPQEASSGNGGLSPSQLFEQDELPGLKPAAKQPYVPSWIPQ